MNAHCWCGNADLLPFSPQYLKCPDCETLIAAQMPDTDITTVKDDQHDFYGRGYWFAHQEDDLGFTNITVRARADLPERCLHWLRTLLKYKLPPAKALDLGSAHGGFVAMMRWAGFAANGLELSPWVVDFARRTFDIPMLLGPIEAQQIAPASLDVIALMDVLEHLPDPVGTLRYCLTLLKPEGILVIQTPQYPEGESYEELVAQGAPFLEMLQADEHLHLFSKQALTRLFRCLGAEHLAFEPAIFAHYDMFVVVSREPLNPIASEEIEQRLSASSGGRMAQALLDLDARLRGVHEKYLAAEADRAARLEVIERQGAELGRIPGLQAQLAAAEADRAARLEVIERQGSEIGLLHQRIAQIERQIQAASELLSDTRTGALLRVARPAWWQRLQASLDEVAALGHLNGRQQPGNGQGTSYSLNNYIAEIDRFNRAQPNTELLDAIRAYNHGMVDELNKLRPLRGKRLLDIGASPHGYALEQALRLGVAEYVGIGLDVHQPIEVRKAESLGRLLRMDATDLNFDDERFDIIISLSTFEHIGDVAAALQEIRRVLAIGGSALISFEPIWTCSYGHHLHHFGPVSKLMPDWAHLVWDKQQMQRELATIWPSDAPLTLEDAAHWVYESTAINRIGIVQMREHFADCGLVIDWIAPIQDEARDPKRLHEAAAVVALSTEDLMVKGLSVLLNKVAAHPASMEELE